MERWRLLRQVLGKDILPGMFQKTGMSDVRRRNNFGATATTPTTHTNKKASHFYSCHTMVAHERNQTTNTIISGIIDRCMCTAVILIVRRCI